MVRLTLTSAIYTPASVANVSNVDNVDSVEASTQCKQLYQTARDPVPPAIVTLKQGGLQSVPNYN